MHTSAWRGACAASVVSSRASVSCRERAAVLSRDVRLEEDDAPVAEDGGARALHRRRVEHLAHDLRVVVIARDAVDGRAERGEALAQALVTGARLVVHEIAREQDGVGRPSVALRALEDAIEGALCDDAAQRPSRAREEVQVGEMQYARRAHGSGLATIVPAAARRNKQNRGRRRAGAASAAIAAHVPRPASRRGLLHSWHVQSHARLDDALYAYLCEMSLREPLVMRRLREVTATLAEANMQIAPEQGQFMALLDAAHRRALLCRGRGFHRLQQPRGRAGDAGGRARDRLRHQPAVDAHRAALVEGGRRGAQVDLRLAPAADSLRALEAEGMAGQVNMVFIDADKTGYAGYYEQSLGLLRRGGLLLVNNTLWGGAVCDPARNDADTEAIPPLQRDAARRRARRSQPRPDRRRAHARPQALSTRRTRRRAALSSGSARACRARPTGTPM